MSTYMHAYMQPYIRTFLNGCGPGRPGAGSQAPDPGVADIANVLRSATARPTPVSHAMGGLGHADIRLIHTYTHTHIHT